MATLTETFTNIANSIRSKTETTDKITPENMPSMIESITTGGNVAELSITSNGTYTAPEGIDGYTPIMVNVPQDGSPPAEAFVITGNCKYRFANGGWDWFINQYGNQITTENITNAESMFSSMNHMVAPENIPFNINFKDGTAVDCEKMFLNARFKNITEENVAGMNGKIGNINEMFKNSWFKKVPSLTFNNNNYYDFTSVFSGSEIEEIGDFINMYPSNISAIFASAKYLKKLPNFINPNFSRVNNYKYAKGGCNLFQSCYSLRSIPKELMDTLDLIQKGKNYFQYNYSFPYYLFDSCYCLDEIVDLPLGIASDTEVTSDMFTYCFSGLDRIKKITFRMNEDGTPRVYKLKGQVINLVHVGYSVANYENRVIGYNSGCSAADEVYWSPTDFPDSERHDNYVEQKDNPNWWTTSSQYSRYNRTSAVETINSLPDTSAYLASAGGTNTIKFEGASGSLTDGGAINTMTEEEIAVATAKGWTVSFV